jgi:hypothetical protein
MHSAFSHALRQLRIFRALTSPVCSCELPSRTTFHYSLRKKPYGKRISIFPRFAGRRLLTFGEPYGRPALKTAPDSFAEYPISSVRSTHLPFHMTLSSARFQTCIAILSSLAIVSVMTFLEPSFIIDGSVQPYPPAHSVSLTNIFVFLALQCAFVASEWSAVVPLFHKLLTAHRTR